MYYLEDQSFLWNLVYFFLLIMENDIYTYMLHYNSETTYKLHKILSLVFREIYQDVHLCGMLRLVQKISELFI